MSDRFNVDRQTDGKEGFKSSSETRMSVEEKVFQDIARSVFQVNFGSGLGNCLSCAYC
jgi:hypothetical protein